MTYFNRDKAIEVILFIAEKMPSSATMHGVSKMLYFADKMHLERYGRLICGDKYIKMQHGPVPSGIYDILKDGKGIVFEDAFRVSGWDVIPSRPAKRNELSESDTQCLIEAIKKYGSKSFGSLSDLTHQDSAWINAPENGEMTLESIIEMLDNSEELLEHINDPHP